MELEAASREEEAAPGVEVVPEPRKDVNGVDIKKDENTAEDDAKKFGLVTEADKEVDDQAVQKLNAMLAERYYGVSHCLFISLSFQDMVIRAMCQGFQTPLY